MCLVNIETAHSIVRVMLFIMMGLNAWCAWMNWRSKMRYDSECERLREVSAAFESATQSYQEAYDKLMEIRERVLNDDRNEDEPGAGNE